MGAEGRQSRSKIHTMRVTKEENQRNGIEKRLKIIKLKKIFCLYIEMTHHTPGKINPEQPTLSNRRGKNTFPSILLLHTTLVFLLITLGTSFLTLNVWFFSPHRPVF